MGGILLRLAGIVETIQPPRRLFVFALCYSVILIRFFFVSVDDSGRARSASRGDGFSDKNVLSAARYFHDFGFLESYFQPVVGYAGDGKYRPESDVKVYLHYPPLPDVLAGAVARITGSTDERVLRSLPLLLSIFWFFLIYRVLGLLVTDPRVSGWAATLVVTSNYFIAWADNLCYHLYSELLLWALVGLAYPYFQKERSGGRLAVIWGLYFLASLTSFDAMVYFAIVVAGLSWIFDRSFLRREVILLATAPVIAFGLRFSQNALYLGGFEAALADFAQAASTRTLGGSLAEVPFWQKLYLLPTTWLGRVERFFLIPGYSLLVICWFGLRTLAQLDRRSWSLGLVLLVATLAWPVLMQQHSFHHVFTTRQLGIFFGFIVGTGMVAYFQQVKADVLGGRTGRCIAHVLVISYTVLMASATHLYQLYLRYGLLVPFRGQ